MFKGKMSVFISVFVLVAFAGVLECNGQDKWQPKQFKLIAPFAPGGGGDTSSRLLAGYLSEELGAPVVVENIPGGNSLTGTMHFLRNEPKNGEVILRMIEFHLSGARLRSDAFTYDDFAVVASDMPTAIGLFVRADAPWKTFNDLLADMEKRPGRISVSYLPGTAMHVAIEVMEKELGVDITKLPYDGGGPQRTSLLGGHHNAAISGFETTMGIVGDQARPLLIFDSERHEWRDDVPTLQDIVGRKVPHPAMRYGYLVHREVKDNYPERFEILVKAFENALKHPEHAKRTREAQRRLGYLGPDEGTRVLKGLAEIADGFKNILGNLKFHGNPSRGDAQ